MLIFTTILCFWETSSTQTQIITEEGATHHRWPNSLWHQCSKHTDVLSGFSNSIISNTLTNTWLTSEIIQWAGGSGTYNFDAVARSGGEYPGACLLAGVFIRPIGAGDGATDTIHRVITASCKKTSLSQNRLLYHVNMEQSNTALKLFVDQKNTRI